MKWIEGEVGRKNIDLDPDEISMRMNMSADPEGGDHLQINALLVATAVAYGLYYWPDVDWAFS